MADDTMELSSEHGHNIGDEDIDIDIDFTAGNLDEDYVLEDALSNAGFGDSLQPQPSPPLGNDDVMIEDGDEPYPMHMDGADLMRDDDAHNMEDESLEISSALAETPIVLIDQNHTASTIHLEDGYMNDEVSWEANDEPDQIGNDSTIENLNLQSQNHHEGESDGEGEDLTGDKDIEQVHTASPHEHSQPEIVLDRGPKRHATSEEPGSPSASIIATEADAQDHSSRHAEQLRSGSSNTQELANKNESTHAEATASTSLLPVMVIYQESEYSLFSESGTDDTDSYFLSDMSVVNRPLSKFFEAIRDVIKDDLTNDEELCISAEDLRLDIEEMSSMTQSVTIGQIMSLHEKLLQNDEVEAVRPLCLLLATRPNFLFRFEALTSGASEGKGLSELVRWDEQSESLDDSAHVTDNGHGDELDGESYKIEEISGERAEKDEHRVAQKESSDADLPEDFTSAEKLQQEAEDTESLTALDTQEIHANDEPVEGQSASRDVLSPQEEVSPSGADEDGDLIDYSDEETQSVQQINAKPSLLKPANDEKRTDNDADPNTNSEVENDIEYDEDYNGNFDDANQEPEGQSANFGEDEAIRSNHHEHDINVENGDVNSGEIVDGHNSPTGSTNEYGEEPFDELDFGEDHSKQHDQFPKFVDQEIPSPGPQATAIGDEVVQNSKEMLSSGTSVGFANAPGSESAASEATLEAQPVASEVISTEFVTVNKDEIDYDDDEEPDIPPLQEPNVKELQASSNESAKRQREDDDESREELKEVKRPRS